jgi:hypothetical protein
MQLLKKTENLDLEREVFEMTCDPLATKSSCSSQYSDIRDPADHDPENHDHRSFVRSSTAPHGTTPPHLPPHTFFAPPCMGLATEWASAHNSEASHFVDAFLMEDVPTWQRLEPKSSFIRLSRHMQHIS